MHTRDTAPWRVSTCLAQAGCRTAQGIVALTGRDRYLVDRAAQQTAASSCETCLTAGGAVQASQLYPLDKDSPLQVRSHQLFAACALFQATGELRYWNDTLTLYDLYFDALDQDLLDSPLYNPSANYRNPQWYALLCMAQSAPDASNIADDPLLAVPEHVDPSAESAGNETAAGWRAGQRAQYRQYLAAQLPETGTRMEVMRQISNNFVYPWLTLESQGSDGDFAQNDRLRCAPVLCCAVLC